MSTQNDYHQDQLQANSFVVTLFAPACVSGKAARPRMKAGNKQAAHKQDPSYVDSSSIISGNKQMLQDALKCKSLQASLRKLDCFHIKDLHVY